MLVSEKLGPVSPYLRRKAGERGGERKMKKYRTKIGDRMSTVRCPFCGVINVYAAKYGQKEACSHRINEYCREYPDIVPENKYTRVFVFENEA